MTTSVAPAIMQREAGRVLNAPRPLTFLHGRFL